jgi:hypothetical protein
LWSKKELIVKGRECRGESEEEEEKEERMVVKVGEVIH